MLIVRKLFYMMAALLTIMTFTFVLMKAIPGDPFMQEKELPKEIYKALKEHYGLNESLWKQYLRYLTSTLCGDFGPSFIYPGRTVNQIIFESFPISAMLGLEALSLAIPAGLFIGCLAAIKQNKWQDHCSMIVTAIGISMPSFILAALLQYLLAIKLGVLPLARWGTLIHTFLPSVSLAILPMAFIARLTRSQMIEILRQDYIKTAKSKGLKQSTIIFRHALRNASIPTLGYLGQLSANILTGSFIVEKIYGIPGLGHWFITSVMTRDYTLIMGITVFYSTILLLIIFLCDLASQVCDPRLKSRLNISNNGLSYAT